MSYPYLYIYVRFSLSFDDLSKLSISSLYTLILDHEVVPATSLFIASQVLIQISSAKRRKPITRWIPEIPSGKTGIDPSNAITPMPPVVRLVRRFAILLLSRLSESFSNHFLIGPMSRNGSTKTRISHITRYSNTGSITMDCIMSYHIYSFIQ